MFALSVLLSLPGHTAAAAEPAAPVVAPAPDAGDPLVTMPELIGPRLHQDLAVALGTGGSCAGPAAAHATVPRGDVPVLLVGEGPDARWHLSDASVSGASAGGRAVLPAELPVGTHRVCVERDGSATAVDLEVVATPYTQIALHELGVDGTERMRSITVEGIRGQAVVSRRWMNSDFLHMDQFYDGQGRELRVNVTHDARGHHYYYDATLVEPVEPGDVLVMDDRGKAEPFSVTQAAPGEFQYAFTHNPNSGVPTRRVDVFRLPEGAAVVTAPGLTQREREGRIELARVATIAPGDSLTTRFRYKVDGVALPSGPAVVMSSPARGALDVDPATTEIRVTFDTDMADHAWSWVQADGNYPKVNGDPRYVDARTCVLPVKLKPETDYVVWVNHPQYDSFRSKEGAPAVPYELRFRTGKKR
jgi:hypothetical protein